ncbi:MAG: hypothetical protein H6581_20565 [Bacteroidia bacterium]|nr:hypothetical protein [Bacteroidia bacterium]
MKALKIILLAGGFIFLVATLYLPAMEVLGRKYIGAGWPVLNVAGLWVILYLLDKVSKQGKPGKSQSDRDSQPTRNQKK